MLVDHKSIRTAPGQAPLVPAPDIIQRDHDGLFQIGIGDDAPGPFESLPFALAVAADQARRQTNHHTN
jgi:hypothetical protein